MKKILRYFLFNLLALYSVEKYLGGVDYASDYRVLLLAAAALTVALVIIRPIIKIVTLPINLLTLGLFSGFINAFLLYGVTYVVPNFSINPFHFEGFTYRGAVIPSFDFGTIGATIAIAAIISVVTSVLSWLTD